MRAGTSDCSFVDIERGQLAILPSLAGFSGEVFVAITDDAGRTMFAAEGPAGASHVVPLDRLVPTQGATLLLSANKPVGRPEGRRLRIALSALDDLESGSISPSKWGVDSDCVAVLREPGDRRVVMRRRIAAGATVQHVLMAQHARELMLEFHRTIDEGLGLGERVGPTLRWMPDRFRGTPPTDVQDFGDGLRASVRRSVTLSPRVLRRVGANALRTEGFVGAWTERTPIVEALDFVLGRQEMLMQPDRPDADRRGERVIYMGRPHSSWGHFLTQGLARVWYAQRHPELPVVWDNPRPLPEHQLRVLEMLGVRNEQLHLSSPAAWDEVVFPFPAVAIGDYVAPGFVQSVGVVDPSPLCAGKKVFLTRSATSNFPGGVEARLDDIVRDHGFVTISPERLSLEEQLAEISSAEVVLAVEGSSLHTPLLLRGPVRSRFWALSRHRRGSGLFEHIRQAKGLNYETLNFLGSRAKRARDPLDLDLNAFERALVGTDGLTKDLEQLESRIERPWPFQSDLGAHLENAQVGFPQRERAVRAAQIALHSGDVAAADRLLRSY